MDKDLLKKIDCRRQDIMIYHVPKENEEDVRAELNFYKYKKLNSKNYTIEDIDTSIPRFAVFHPDMTFFEIKQSLAK